MSGWLMLMLAFGPALLLWGIAEYCCPTKWYAWYHNGSVTGGKGKYITLIGWAGTIALYKMVPGWQAGVAVVSGLCLLFIIVFALYSLAREMADDNKNMDPYP